MSPTIARRLTTAFWMIGIATLIAALFVVRVYLGLFGLGAAFLSLSGLSNCRAIALYGVFHPRFWGGEVEPDETDEE